MLVPCVLCASHTTYTVRNKHEKLEGKGEVSFDTPFMKKSHAESRKKIVGALRIYQLTSTAQSGHN